MITQKPFIIILSVSITVIVTLISILIWREIRSSQNITELKEDTINCDKGILNIVKSYDQADMRDMLEMNYQDIADDMYMSADTLENEDLVHANVCDVKRRTNMPTRISITNEKHKSIHSSFLSNYHPFDFNNITTWYKQKTTRHIIFNNKRHQYFFAFVGGLGDLYQELHVFGVGRFIQNLPVNESALVFLMCNNPSCVEVYNSFDDRHDFYHIPYTANIFESYEGLNFIALPWMLYMHRRHEILVDHYIKSYTHTNWLYDHSLPSHPQPYQKYIMLQRCAGTRDRDLPIDFVRDLIAFFTKRKVHVIHTGKHTIRGFGGGYDEPIPRINKNVQTLLKWDNEIDSSNPFYHYYVDKTNMGETTQLIKNSLGIVSCHSNLFLTAMQFQIPVFVLCTVIHKENMFNFSTDNSYNAIFGSLHFTKEPLKYRYAYKTAPIVNNENFSYMTNKF
jgi:hypothetical protein